ncbi:MAG: HEAT repeat domain-containing protein [Planctomycetes bacterium]|nr:HEAT repeat domain-containing protein [Planctomycetota bacterium]
MIRTIPHLSNLWAIAYVLLISIDVAWADVYEMKDGGQVAGNLIDRGKDGEYVVETTEGAVVTLTRKQVRRVVSQDAKYLEYVKLSRSLPDTADAHRMIIDWCKESKLNKLTDHHRRRLLELDPSDEQARASLGFQQHQGRWLTQEEIMAQRGFVRYDGAYRTVQDIALRENEKRRKTEEVDWQRKIRLWRNWLDDRRSAEAVQLISEINDPYAAPALVKFLEKERNLQVRDLLLETLAELKHPQAATTLVNFSLNNPDREVRLQCLDYLIKYHQPISLRTYVKVLKHRDNVMVNRAAEALQEIGNPEALSPLIDSLITTHKYKNGDAPPGDITTSFSSDSGGGGGGGLSFGGAPKIRKIDQKNLDVRQALVELSGGQDFEYNRKAWRRWYINQQVREFVDARRDK